MVDYLGTNEGILKHPLVQSLLNQAKINKIKLDYILDFSIVKKFKTKDRFVIAGYASVEVIDTQNELIPIETLKESFDRFMKTDEFALSSIMHSNIPIAKILKEYTDSEGTKWVSHVNEDGLFIVAEVRQDIKKGEQTCDLIEKGVLTGFSIGGEALATSTVCEGPTGSSCYTKIDKLDIHEIAIVDRPANQPSVFTIVKRYEPMLKVWEETEENIRSGHGDLASFDKDSMRTITIDQDKGIKAIVGCPKGNYEGGKCKVGVEVQSFLFDKEKWTMERAKKWFKKHKDAKKVYTVKKGITVEEIKAKLIEAFKRRDTLQKKINDFWSSQPKPSSIIEVERSVSMVNAEISALEKALGELIIKGSEDPNKVRTGEQPEGDEELEKVDSLLELGKVMKGPVDRLGFKLLLLRVKALKEEEKPTIGDKKIPYNKIGNMKKAEFNGQEGKWVTIRGKKVFIPSGYGELDKYELSGKERFLAEHVDKHGTRYYARQSVYGDHYVLLGRGKDQEYAGFISVQRKTKKFKTKEEAVTYAKKHFPKGNKKKLKFYSACQVLKLRAEALTKLKRVGGVGSSRV